MNIIKKILIPVLVPVLATIAEPAHAVIEKLSCTEVQNLLMPITFNNVGMELFFKERFNQRRYTCDILHSSFVHMIDLLEYAQGIEKKRAYVNMVFELFLTRTKACNWINPFALAQLLEKLPHLIKDVCQDDEAEVKDLIKSTLYEALANRYDQLNEDPEKFMSDLTNALYAIKTADEEYISPEELRSTIVRFIESACSKLIWSPEDQEDTWNCCKLIGNQIMDLLEIDAIPNEKVANHLIWSLIYRYGYFMETMASELTVKTYDIIKQDVASAHIPFLLISEQERLMTSKIEHLSNCILESEIIHKIEHIQG